MKELFPEYVQNYDNLHWKPLVIQVTIDTRTGARKTSPSSVHASWNHLNFALVRVKTV